MAVFGSSGYLFVAARSHFRSPCLDVIANLYIDLLYGPNKFVKYIFFMSPISCALFYFFGVSYLFLNIHLSYFFYHIVMILPSPFLGGYSGKSRSARTKTLWLLWRESKKLQIFIEPYFPLNATLYLYLQGFSFCHFNRVHGRVQN